MPVFLMGVVRGLVSEGDVVLERVTELAPDILALSLSKEGIEAISAMLGNGSIPDNEPESMNPEEEFYIAGLSRFGRVIKPPPCFTEAVRYARDKTIPMRALDMDDEHYSAAYCKYVSGMDLIRHGRAMKALARHKFRADCPGEFVMEWDRLVNRPRGYLRLEMARERWMARVIAHSAGGERMLAIIERERLPGVQTALGNLGCEFSVLGLHSDPQDP